MRMNTSQQNKVESSEACAGVTADATCKTLSEARSRKLTFCTVDAAETLSQLREFEASLQKMMAGDMTLVSELGLLACRRRRHVD